MRAFQDSTTTPAPSSKRRLSVVAPGADSRTTGPAATVARYDDYRRALAAITELCEHGKRPRELHLASSEFEHVQVRPDSDVGRELSRALAPALVAAGGWIAAASIVGGVSLTGGFGVVVATTVAVAAVAAGVVALLRARGEGMVVPKERLVPVAYELRCHPADASEAERHLAGWWQTGLDGPPRSAGGRRIVRR